MLPGTGAAFQSWQPSSLDPSSGGQLRSGRARIWTFGDIRCDQLFHRASHHRLRHDRFPCVVAPGEDVLTPKALAVPSGGLRPRLSIVCWPRRASKPAHAHVAIPQIGGPLWGGEAEKAVQHGNRHEGQQAPGVVQEQRSAVITPPARRCVGGRGQITSGSEAAISLSKDATRIPTGGYCPVSP